MKALLYRDSWLRLQGSCGYHSLHNEGGALQDRWLQPRGLPASESSRAGGLQGLGERERRRNPILLICFCSWDARDGCLSKPLLFIMLLIKQGHRAFLGEAVLQRSPRVQGFGQGFSEALRERWRALRRLGLLALHLQVSQEQRGGRLSSVPWMLKYVI